MLQFLISTVEDSGDKLVFEDIYYKYKDATMRRALRLLNGNHYDTEEALQMAWIQIFRNIDKIRTRNEKAISTYIMKTVEYKSINVAKKNKAWQETKEELMISKTECISDDALYLLCAKESEEKIKEVIVGMEDKHKDVLIFFYLHGLKVGTIAEHMGISQNAVRKRIYRAKNALAEKLEQEGIGNRRD